MNRICKPEPDTFIVWNPHGKTPPTAIYESHRVAMGVAKFMAKKFPGDIFYVMRSEGCFQRQIREEPIFFPSPSYDRVLT